MSNQTETTTCPRCRGSGIVAAFVETATHGYFDPMLQCSLCRGDGHISATTADWLARGEVHYKARVARGESASECARRLGISAAELSGMEHGRADPSRLETSP